MLFFLVVLALAWFFGFLCRRLELGGTHPHTLESWNNLINLYEAWGKLEKADEVLDIDDAVWTRMSWGRGMEMS